MSARRTLADAHGIAPSYHDIFGTLHETTDETLVALLAAIGVDASTDAVAGEALAAHRAARWRTALPALVVVREGDEPWRLSLRLPAAVDVSDLHVRLATEHGDVRGVRVAVGNVRDECDVDGERCNEYDVEFSLAAPIGYHRATFHAGGVELARSMLAVAPRRCYRPPGLDGDRRTFGAAVQLYALRSRRNWGIGDFTDLGDVCERWGAHGAGIVGVNPLHALFPHNPSHASPYSPSSRLFANTLYLDVESIDEFGECAEARAHVQADAFQRRLARLRDTAEVDYAGVAEAKREVLEQIFAWFASQHRDRGTPRAHAFDAFKREGGEALARHALFEALQEHCHASDRSCWGWPAWPERFRHPNDPAVARFATSHRDRIDFHAYLQWQADLQRAGVARRARDAGLTVGLYTDLAVSIDRGGAESWAHQDLYATGASVGAPPDAFNPQGQDWGLPPMVPSRLVEAGFAPFIATLRANMRHAGALRIDHVMGLMRLFWVPPQRTPREGAYVRYPFDDLMALLALESQRHRCLVIGEDLGTVPDEVRTALAEHDVLSYRVLLFERDQGGMFKPPGAYPAAALATASTHDLPTLAGWWEGRDIDVRASLGLTGDDERDRQQRERRLDRVKLVHALAGAELLPDGATPDDPMTPGLAQAIQAFLAATPSVLEIVQLEDALLVREQPNLPGTIDEHPNWRRKLPDPIETAFDTPEFHALAERLARMRPRPAPAT